MKRLGLNLNPFLYLNKTFPLSHFSVQHIISLAELEGVDAFSMFFGGTQQLLSKRESLLLNAISFKFINISVKSGEESFKDILETKPSMLTFTNGLDDSTFETFSTRISEHPEFFENATDWVKKSNLLCAIKLKPELSEVKLAAKLQFDYIEFDLSDINSSENLTEELQEIEKLKIACIAAEKYGFGISTSGLITNENKHIIQPIKQIEEFYTSKHFFERSIIKGINHSIYEYKK